jgi:hypothetical protein
MAINNNQVFQNKLTILIHTISRFWYFVTFCLTWCKLSSFDHFQLFVPYLLNTMSSSNIFPHFICTMLKFWYFTIMFSYDLGYDFEIWSSITHKNTFAQNIHIVHFIKTFCCWIMCLIWYIDNIGMCMACLINVGQQVKDYGLWMVSKKWYIKLWNL